jgi:hypothetical protein
MADEWDSSSVWAEARARTRAEVQAAFAPKPRTCPSCGREEATAARNCPHCGASYVVVQPKLSKKAKLTIAGATVGVLAAAGIAWLIASPSINHSKRSAAERAAAQQAAFVRSETKRLRIDQRLHRGRALTRGEKPAAIVTNLESAITADAQQRVKAGTLSGPIQGTKCEPVKLGPLIPNAVRGGYQCIAINANIPKEGHGATAMGGTLGYPFWAVVDYRRGGFAWCKINPKPGEMATRAAAPVVNPPAGCDLHI